ncbi:zinc-binding dehydrogenase, partial [Vibrio parahaemolyticus]
VTVGLHPIIMNNGCKDMNVVVIGAGTIGLLTVQVAKALGAKTVTAVDVSDDKLVLAKELGADFTVNSLNDEQVKWLAENDELTSDQLILELAGVPATFKLSLKIAGPRSHIYLIGTIHKDFDMTFKEYEQILRKEATITGSWMNYSYLYPGKEWEVASQLFLEDKINTSRLLDGIYGPLEYIERVSSLPTEPLRGKVLLNWV